MRKEEGLQQAADKDDEKQTAAETKINTEMHNAPGHDEIDGIVSEQIKQLEEVPRDYLHIM